MAISTKLLREMTKKGWSEYCMVEKKAITTIADELDALRAPKARTGEVQYQARLRDPLLPECNVWMNITEAGANSIRAKHTDVYEVRELVERHARYSSEPLCYTTPEAVEGMRSKRAAGFSVRTFPVEGIEIPLFTEQPHREATHAEIANAATKHCLDRTGADGWIFNNTEQLQAFLDALK
jgi:hypothetical protein